MSLILMYFILDFTTQRTQSFFQYLKYGGITAHLGSDKLQLCSDKTQVGQW